MKHTYLLFLAPALFITSYAHATTPHAYANAITAHNIATLQHSITHTAFDSFEGSMAATLNENKPGKTIPALDKEKKSPYQTYGRAPMYGHAATYGEYNDDGSAGRSGGDKYNTDASLNNIWFAYEHISDDVKIDDFTTLDSNQDLGIMGLSGGHSKWGNGITQWGIYTGYIGAHQRNNEINIDSQGGFFGVYNGFSIDNFNLSTSIISGVLDNTATSTFGDDGYTNFWISGIANATYSIHLDDTFTLQPGVQFAYTWIKAEDYTSVSGDTMKNDAFNMIEVSPTLRAIKHIGSGWYGSLNLKHIMIFANGGDLTVNDTTIPELNIGDFTEYSLSLEKSIANISLTANFGRRDGAHRGWIGGINLKVRF